MPEEKIIEAVYGIYKTGRTQLSSTKVGPLTLGHTPDTENTLFVTNYRLLFVTIPMLGQGIEIDTLDVSFLQGMFNKNSLKEKGGEMINTMTPQAIFESNPSNSSFPFQELQSVKFGWFSRVIVRDKNNNKFDFTVTSKDSLAKLKEVLMNYIPDKII